MAKLKGGRHTQSKKAHRQNIKHYQYNLSKKEEIKRLIKAIKKAVNNKELEKAKSLFKEAQSKIDKAVKKSVFHYKKGARKKSRLMNLINTISSSPQ